MRGGISLTGALTRFVVWMVPLAIFYAAITLDLDMGVAVVLAGVALAFALYVDMRND